MSAAAGHELEILLAQIRACRRCVTSPIGRPLPHAPRPVLVASRTARLAIAGQAPGTRVHASGIPFCDPSGDRLRAWMGVTPEQFYDASRIAIVPMGFCFPGLDEKGGDRPPRRECAALWRDRVMAALPQVELLLLVGRYAQSWHLGEACEPSLTATVAAWRRHLAAPRRPRLLPLPHPSWRNNSWLIRNAWFKDELLPALREQVGLMLAR
jgi:uracil-DNA glycosylase